MIKEILLSIALVFVMAFSASAIDTWNNYPDDTYSTCHQEWKEGYSYYKEIHPHWETVPEVIPEEGFEVEADVYYCQDPNGYWLAEYGTTEKGHHEETFVPRNKYRI